jgi:hypothetical protein
VKYNYNGVWKDINIKVADTLPVGTIIPFGGTVIPANYRECDGSTLSRTEYALLFAAIGTSFGEGDGSTTFNLPDLRGDFPDQIVKYIIKVLDAPASGIRSETLPVGTEVDFDGVATDIPTGWQSITDPGSYSRSEVKTGNTWVDNKPIYRQVFTFSNIALSNGVTINTPISNMNTLVKHQIYYHNNEINQHLNFPLVEISGNTLGYTYSNGQITFRGLGSWSASNSRYIDIIIEYTKTTD